MKRLILFLTLIFPVVGLSQDDQFIQNLAPGKDVVIKVTESGGSKVEVARFKASGDNTLVPSGSVMMYAGVTIPSGWVLGDGTAYNAVSDTSFANLYAALLNTYGGADATDFQVPDCSGRMIAGKESSQSRLTSGVSGVNGGVLGAAGGDQRGFQHNHGAGSYAVDPDSAVFNTGGVSTSAARTHTGYWMNSTGYNQQNTGVAQTGGSYYLGTIPAHADHSHAVTVNLPNKGATGTSSNAGSGTSENVPPVIVMNCIVKK